jgi:hypothetical protein
MAYGDSDATVTIMLSAPPPNTSTAVAAQQTTTTSGDTQPHSPLFCLARELRDMIYDYTFTPTSKISVDGSPQIVELGDLAATAPSSSFLLTCRQANQEASADFRIARRLFLREHTISINLSDDWEHVPAIKQRHYEVLDLLDVNFLLPGISDEQVNAMKTLVVNVNSDIGSFEIHLDGKRSSGRPYWRLNQDASTWGVDPTDTLTNGHYPRRTLTEVLRARSSPERNSLSLTAAHRHFHITSLRARGASGRRYKSMSASREMLAKVEARRADLATNLPSVSKVGLKKRQLEALLEHCWIVWRARRAA